MRFRFLWLGKTRDPHFSRLEDRYLERLQQFVPSDRVLIPELKKIDPRQRKAQLQREAQLIERKLNPNNSFLVVLAGEGRQLSSVELASEIESLLNQGLQEITFIVGGYSGVPHRVSEAASLKWSLGRLTLPHELARTIVLEQVYRAMSIIKRLPYHK